MCWPEDEDGFIQSYCTRCPRPRVEPTRPVCAWAWSAACAALPRWPATRRAGGVVADDVLGGAVVMLSVFLHEPQFQGQTKEKLTSPEATRLVESTVKDHFDHWLSADPAAATRLLDRVVERAEERARRRSAREMARKSATRRLRLPGKLADCSPGHAGRDGAVSGRGRLRRRHGKGRAAPGRPRRSCRCAARSSTWPVPRRTSWRRTRRSRIWSRPWAAAPVTAMTMPSCATSGSSS